jgi:hypothetical protein
MQGGGATARMPMDIRQSLLHDSEDCNFLIMAQTTDVIRNVNVHCDLAPLGEAVHVPAESRGKSDLFE